MQFCDQTGLTNGSRTKLDYLNGLKRLDDVFIPTDLSDYYYTHGTNITDKQRKGLLKFFNYLETLEMVREFNEYPLELFKTNLRIAQKGEERMSARLKDLTNEEVIKTREGLPDRNTQVYFTLLAISGARHSQLYKLLKNPNRFEIEKISKDAIRVDARSLSSGTKNAFYYYFPAELETAIRKYRHSVSYDRLGKILNQSSDDARNANAASLRKWNYNLLINNPNKVEMAIADHFQGRASKGVGSSHYAEMNNICKAEYPPLVDKIKDALPIPDWIISGNFENTEEKRQATRRKQQVRKINRAIKEKEKQKQKKIKEEQEKEKKVLEMLKDGKSNREIIAAVHIGKNKIKKIADDNGIFRS